MAWVVGLRMVRQSWGVPAQVLRWFCKQQPTQNAARARANWPRAKAAHQQGKMQARHSMKSRHRIISLWCVCRKADGMIMEKHCMSCVYTCKLSR